MDLDDHQNSAATIIDLAQQAETQVPAQIVDTPDGRRFAIHRDDFQLKDITPTNAAEVLPPKIIDLTTQLQTSQSLSQYLHRFKDMDSIMFADVVNSRITAILDYHVRPEGNQPITDVNDGAKASPYEPAKPRHAAHCAVLWLRHSQEWVVWTSQNEKLMSHLAFASFLEENGVDIIQPSGGALLELCKDLQVRGSADFKSSIRQGDVVSIEYSKSDDVSTKDNLELPAEIMIAIPVYFGEPPITMNVLLRRKIEDGKLFLGFKIKRLENHKQDEFLRIVNEVSADTDVEAVLGNPA